MKATEKTRHAWENMKQRCTNPKHTSWPLYGGRGVTYDPRWERFEHFFIDMGESPPGLSLDRINVNLPYSKENCRWATAQVQALNVRPRGRNQFGINGIAHRGNTYRVQARVGSGLRLELYTGKDFFEACCARKSWENRVLG